MIVTKEIIIAMGHSVTNHSSKCRGLHGHDYRIIAGVDGELIQEEGSSEGMVIDFGDLKRIMMNVIDKYYDHGFCIYEKDPRISFLRAANDVWHFEKERFHELSFVPTAENLAKHWFDLLAVQLSRINIKLRYLQVYETPTSAAIYSPEEK